MRVPERWVVPAALPLTGCLLLADPPEFAPWLLFDSVPQCENNSDCPDGWICDDIFNDCERKCVDEECPGGHACYPDEDDLNTCDDYCIDNSGCQADYRCCDYEDREAGRCDYGECIRR